MALEGVAAAKRVVKNGLIRADPSETNSKSPSAKEKRMALERVAAAKRVV